MADGFTNRGLVLQVTGSNIGTWGEDLNINDITITDAILASTLPVTLSSGTTPLTQTQSQNLAFALSGAITTDIIVTLPLNFNSGSVAMGGFFIFSNATTGSHSVTVKTVASGSTGVTIFQNTRTILYSNGTHVYYADDGSYAVIRTCAGDPNGVVTGNAGSATTPVDIIWDRTNFVLYVSKGTTVWTSGGAVDLSTVTGILSIVHGGTSNSTAAGARGPTGLNIDEMTITSANASYTILATDRTVATSAAAMTLGNTWTLPAANTINAGQAITVTDLNGVVGTFTLTIARAASDTINGATSIGLSTRYGGFRFISDGVSKWSAEGISPTAPVSGYTASNGIILVGTDFQLDTNNTLGIGSTILATINSNSPSSPLSVATGATVSGAYLSLFTFSGSPQQEWTFGQVTGTLPGTWRNISGADLFQFSFLSSNVAVLMMRVS